jgi:hypothetical protein
MARTVLPFALATGLFVALSGCGVFEKPQRPAWRGQAENACLAQKLVKPSAYLQPASAVDGPGICGLEHPFKAVALADGTVTLNSTQTLGCPMIAGLEAWIQDSVQPSALARFGVPVAKISSMGSLSCRSIDNLRGAKLSEHAFGNAMDVGGFVLADGREINVMRGWKGQDEQVRAFLREVQAGACGIFTTVLAPGSDSFHYNHIHLDLAMHGNTSTGPRRYCKPVPSPQFLPPPQRRDNLPDAPDIEEELDVAQSMGRGALAMHGLDASVPAAPMPMGRVPMSTRRLSAIAPPTNLRPPMALGQNRATIRDDGVYDPGED